MFEQEQLRIREEIPLLIARQRRRAAGVLELVGGPANKVARIAEHIGITEHAVARCANKEEALERLCAINVELKE